MKTEQKVFTIFLLFVALIMTIASLRFGAGAKILPFFSGLFTLAILAVLVLMNYSPKFLAWYQALEKKPVLEGEELKKEEKKKELSVTLWFVGCTALIYLLGFQIGTPLFLFLFLKIREKESWLISLILSIAVLLVVYSIFMKMLHVPLHKGIFFE